MYDYTFREKKIITANILHKDAFSLWQFYSGALSPKGIMI